MVDADGKVLGVPCYVMEKVDGHVIRGELPDGFASASSAKASLAYALVDTLVALHKVDPMAVGLDGLGRPSGYLDRQLSRWTNQWELSADQDVPEITELATWLRCCIPPSTDIGGASIVHGDFRLDNCVIGAAEPPRVEAVLDWELATLGDPLSDLGMLLFYWREPNEPEIPLLPTVSKLAGFPTRRDLAARYAEGAQVSIADIDFYIAFANLKFAVIAQGIAARAESGAMAGQSFGDLHSTVVDCARAGLEILRTRG
jgi:aminoglycoside phosphotransferase (APT) family kinase protein